MHLFIFLNIKTWPKYLNKSTLTIPKVKYNTFVLILNVTELKILRLISKN